MPGGPLPPRPDRPRAGGRGSERGWGRAPSPTPPRRAAVLVRGRGAVPRAEPQATCWAGAAVPAGPRKPTSVPGGGGRSPRLRAGGSPVGAGRRLHGVALHGCSEPCASPRTLGSRAGFSSRGPGRTARRLRDLCERVRTPGRSRWAVGAPRPCEALGTGQLGGRGAAFLSRPSPRPADGWPRACTRGVRGPPPAALPVPSGGRRPQRRPRREPAGALSPGPRGRWPCCRRARPLAAPRGESASGGCADSTARSSCASA